MSIVMGSDTLWWNLVFFYALYTCMDPSEPFSNLLVSHLRIHKELNKHKSSPARVNIYLRGDNYMIFTFSRALIQSKLQ